MSKKEAYKQLFKQVFREILVEEGLLQGIMLEVAKTAAQTTAEVILNEGMSQYKPVQQEAIASKPVEQMNRNEKERMYQRMGEKFNSMEIAGKKITPVSPEVARKRVENIARMFGGEFDPFESTSSVESSSYGADKVDLDTFSNPPKELLREKQEAEVRKQRVASDPVAQIDRALNADFDSADSEEVRYSPVNEVLQLKNKFEVEEGSELSSEQRAMIEKSLEVDDADAGIPISSIAKLFGG